MGNQPIQSERIDSTVYCILVSPDFKLHSEYKEITFSGKKTLFLMVPPGPLKSPLDCDCLFQRYDDACGSWRLTQDITT